MFVTTLYSFKGGVGRTMALVNIAAELTLRGRRVLLVDFDLEAPGLSTYDIFSKASNNVGLVDFVTEFLETNEAPSVDKYIVECPIDGEDGLSIWVMSAGRRDRDYSSKLSAIDWPKLYRDRYGFLLFEDLKEQWRKHLSPQFDYVLIDSRTGHTDVGGICTRQLPNSVVLLYYPNYQNLIGMASIVNEIRQEPRDFGNEIQLLFCAANVPDLDDENGILAKQLESAAELLEFEREPLIIHHYDSMDLLTQAVFVKDRPKTKLANEYRTICDAIIKSNIRDHDGALAALDEVRHGLRDVKKRPKRLRRRRFEELESQFEWRVDEIQKAHPRDGEISWALASVYSEMGNIESEMSALTIAIESNYKPERARRVRGMRLLQNGRTEEALADFKSILNSSDADVYDFVTALDNVRRHDPNWDVLIKSSPALAKLVQKNRDLIVSRLSEDPKGSRIAADLLSSGATLLPSNTENLVLCLIGSGQYEKALEAFRRTREEIEKSENIGVVFNYAMAEWGTSKSPPTDLFRRVIDLSAREEKIYFGANFSQCLALAHVILGDATKAIEDIANSREQLGAGTVFSCWQYLYVNRDTMLNDLQEMEEQIDNPSITPPFLKRSGGVWR